MIMSELSNGYKIALLDSAFFSSEFTPEVKNGLSSIKVYVANSFNAEIEQYKEVLSDERRSAYEKNVAFLETLNPKKLNMDSTGDKKREINNDTWGMISLLVSLKAKFVVVTSNKILIQRIILNSLDADIYDLNENRFIHSAEFESVRSRYEISNAVLAPLPAFSFKISESSILFCTNGNRVTLGDEFNSGLEANLYRIKGRNDLIAKVFKKGKLSREKLANILDLVGMNEKMGISWAIFPRDILYYDEACTIPAGFIEKYVKTDENLDRNPLFLGDINLPERYLNMRQSTAIELAIKIVRQVCYLNSYGFFISDFNIGNFATVANNNKTIQMWDTDSFGFNNYFSGYCAGNQTSCEYDTTKKLGAIDYCIDALYLFVFSLLSLGDPPISEYSGKFKYDNPNYPFLFRKCLFPDNLWELFTEIFRGGKVPSAETLLEHLSVAYNDLSENPSKNKTYGELLAVQLTKVQPAGNTNSNENEVEVEEGEEGEGEGEDSGTPPKTKRKVWLWVLIILAVAIAVFAIAGNWDKISSCVSQPSANNNQYSMVIETGNHQESSTQTVITADPTTVPTQKSTTTPTPTPTPTPVPTATPKPVMPNLLGRTTSDAASILNELGINFQVWWHDGDCVSEPYYIIHQSVSEGSNVGSSTTVKLQTSSDPNQRYIDDFSWYYSDDWAELDYWYVHPTMLYSYYKVRSFQVTLHLDNIDFNTGTPYGDWAVYVHTSSGEWVRVKDVYISGNTTSIFVRLKNAKTIDGVVMERLSSAPCDHSLWLDIDLVSITN